MGKFIVSKRLIIVLCKIWNIHLTWRNCYLDIVFMVKETYARMKVFHIFFDIRQCNLFILCSRKLSSCLDIRQNIGTYMTPAPTMFKTNDILYELQKHNECIPAKLLFARTKNLFHTQFVPTKSQSFPLVWSLSLHCSSQNTHRGRLFNKDNRSSLTLLLLVANLANTKWNEILKNDWNPGKWVLIWEFSARATQWIPIWQGSDVF